MHKKLWWLLVLVLTACSQQTATPAVTPQSVTVQITPALRAWTPALSTCAVGIPGLVLLPQEKPASSLDVKQADLSFRWGAPKLLPASAVPVGSEKLVFIVNQQNPLRSLSVENVRALFAGRVDRWVNLVQSEGSSALPDQPISLYGYAQNEDSRAVLVNQLMDDAPLAVETQLTPDPAAMLDAVAADPNAIGYLPARWLTDAVRPLEITGLSDGQLEQPVLALSAAEPQGLALQLLLCLQK